MDPRITAILVIDDNASIVEDFRRVLCPPVVNPDLSALEQEVFGEVSPTAETPLFEVFGASQGERGLEKILEAKRAGHPFPLAFVDVRMPPGWDGIETAKRIWEADPAIQLVICTAYSDYTWEDMVLALGRRDRLLILKKPFDDIEVQQLAVALTRKWTLERDNERRMSNLSEIVALRTQEIKASNTQLKEQIARQELLEAKLRQAEKLEALGRLMAGLSHEINNPLTFVIANVQFARDCLASIGTAIPAASLEELHECLADIHTGAQRIQRLVADVKLFSRAKHLGTGHADMREVIHFAVKLSNHENRGKARIETTFAENLPNAAAPAAQLEQVIVNLLQNSLHAFPSDAADNKILVSAATNETGQLVVRVVDNGCGISEEDQSRIFDPFFTTKRFGQGTGLGLSICHGVVEGLGGKIAVDSTLGAGTTVEVLLPALSDAALQQAQQSAAAARTGQEPVIPDDERPHTILAVDDEPGMLRAIKRGLGKQELTTCTNAEAALDLVAATDFDAILVDVQMPGMDGIRFFERLAEMSPGAQARVIFMTGGPANDDAKLRLEGTHRPCLVKPFTIEELRQAVAPILHSARETAPLGQ